MGLHAGIESSLLMHQTHRRVSAAVRSSFSWVGCPCPQPEPKGFPHYFKMYPGLSFLIRYSKMTDTETTGLSPCLGRAVDDLQSPRERAGHAVSPGPRVEAPGVVKRQEQGRAWAPAFSVVPVGQNG